MDLAREEASIASLAEQLAHRREGLGAPIDLPGFFTGLIAFGEWALTLNTDGVGTKMLAARDVGRWDTVGIDCVAMNVNDALCVGAEPLAMVDYLAVGTYDEAVTRDIGVGLDRGAREANITIVGGEFATVPELVADYDLVGTCLGAVKQRDIIDGSQVAPGQVVLGLRSHGLHSNGYTLVRRLLQAESVDLAEGIPHSAESWAEALLTPTAIYVREVLDVLPTCDVRGMVHFTGGGLRKLTRIPAKVGFEIEAPFSAQPVFLALQELGGLEDREMYRTFNMGQGFALILEEDQAVQALEILKGKRDAQIIGHVTSEPGVRLPTLDLVL